MATYRTSVHIEAPISLVSSALYDPGLQPTIWGAEKAELDHVWPNPGGRIRLVRPVGPLHVDTTLVVREHNPPAYHECHFVDGAMRGPNRFRLRPEGNGTTFEIDCDYELHINGLHEGRAGLLERVIERLGSRQVDNALKRFKEMLEQQYATHREPVPA
jgi:hypothetical protein